MTECLDYRIRTSRQGSWHLQWTGSGQPQWVVTRRQHGRFAIEKLKATTYNDNVTCGNL